MSKKVWAFLIIIPLTTGAVFIGASKTNESLPAWHTVTHFRNIPIDGPPRRFVVRLRRDNAWGKHAPESLDQAVLRRSRDGFVIAFSTFTYIGGQVSFDEESHDIEDCCSDVHYDLQGHPDVADVPDLLRYQIRIIEGEVQILRPNRSRWQPRI